MTIKGYPIDTGREEGKINGQKRGIKCYWSTVVICPVIIPEKLP